MKVLFRGAASPDLYDFGFPPSPAPEPVFRPWLLPDGRAVLERRQLPFLKRSFLPLVLLRVYGGDLRRWM